MQQIHLDFANCPQEGTWQTFREKDKVVAASSLPGLRWQVLEETVGLFLSGLGHGKVSYEIINALECLGHSSAVVLQIQGNWVEGICIYEAPELGACCVVGEQCIQQLWPWSPKASRILENI